MGVDGRESIGTSQGGILKKLFNTKKILNVLMSPSAGMIQEAISPRMHSKKKLIKLPDENMTDLISNIVNRVD